MKLGSMAMLSLVVASGMVLFSGCAVNPTTMPIGARDSATYVDQGAQEQFKEKKMRLAVAVSQGDYSKTGDLATALDSSLVSALSDFAFFTIVERSNVSALHREKILKGEQIDELADAADFLISAKLNGFNQVVESTSYNPVLKQNATSYTVNGSVDFRFYSSNSGKTLMTKNITKSYSGSSQQDLAAAAMKIAQECAKAFAQELGSRYAPPVRIVETRGDAHVAQAAFGSNYGAVKGSKVEIFDYVDNSAIIKGQTRAPRVIATGVILSSDLTTCWIEIDDYEKVQVMRGHYVRLATDQSKGLLQGMTEGLPTL